MSMALGPARPAAPPLPQADNLVASLTFNAGHNCCSTEIIVTAQEWRWRDRFLEAVRCSLICRNAACGQGSRPGVDWPQDKYTSHTHKNTTRRMVFHLHGDITVLGDHLCWHLRTSMGHQSPDGLLHPAGASWPSATSGWPTTRAATRIMQRSGSSTPRPRLMVRRLLVAMGTAPPNPGCWLKVGACAFRKVPPVC